MTKKLTPKNIGEGIDQLNPKAFGIKTNPAAPTQNSQQKKSTILLMGENTNELKAEDIKDPTERRRAILRELQNDPYYNDTPTLDDGTYKRKKRFEKKTIAIIAIIFIVIAVCVITILLEISRAF